MQRDTVLHALWTSTDTSRSLDIYFLLIDYRSLFPMPRKKFHLKDMLTYPCMIKHFSQNGKVSRWKDN